MTVREELYQHDITSFLTMTRVPVLDCSAPTCCDVLAVLASLAIVLQMVLYNIEYYKNRH